MGADECRPASVACSCGQGCPSCSDIPPLLALHPCGQICASELSGKGTSKAQRRFSEPIQVFTPFEIGAIGLPEHKAIEKYGAENIEVYLKEYENLEIGAAHRLTAVKHFEKDWDAEKKIHVPSQRESNDLPPHALAKLVCLKTQENRVVGFHFVGPNAGEVTQGFGLAMRLGATKQDFDLTVGIHPTDAESFTMLDIIRRSGQDWVASGGCGGGKCG